MSRPERWREQRGRIVHVAGATGDDRTICGDVYEGAALKDDHDPMSLVTRGKIDCPACLRIIAYCKAIPTRYLARRP